MAQTQAEQAEAWLEITVERLKGNIKKLKIGDSGELERSIKGFVHQEAGGDVKKVELFYSWYGMFVDMGVGKGTKQGQQRDNATERKLLGTKRGKSRQPKPWSNKTISAEVKTLSELTGQLYLSQAVEAVYGTTDKKLVMNF